MIDHIACQQAILDRLKTLEVATTGSTDLEATATGYARAAGSFLDDGFEVGMEVVPSGFAANARTVITEVAALALKTLVAPAVEASAPGRTLSAPLPQALLLPNLEAAGLVEGWPYAELEYLPGPASDNTSGPEGVLTSEPTAVVRINVPVRTGPRAAAAYVNALTRLFRPKLALLLPDGYSLRVRTQPAPYAGQLVTFAERPAWATCTFTIPLRIYTRNAP